VTVMAPGHVFAGSDYPYLIQQENLAAFLASTGLAATEIDSLREGAARKFLKSKFEALSPM